jgi:predicted permease
MMRRLTDIWFRVRALLGGGRMDREFTEEAAFHLEMETRELIRGGMDPAQARRQANIAFGGVDSHREKARDARGVRPLEELIQDVRYGIRSLRKSPLFSGVILFVLALGIGASASIFSVVDGILFRSLPYPNAEGILRVFSAQPDDPRGSFSGADYLDIAAQTEAFEKLAGYNVKNFNLVREAGPQRLRGASVTPDFFRVFGVDALIGRTFSPDIEGPGRASTVVLSHGFWQTAFGADSDVLGEPIELNDHLFEIIGVMPPGFDYPGASLWTSASFGVPDPPFATEEDPGLDRGAEYVDVVGHLRQSVFLEEAQSEMAVLAGRLAEEYPEVHESEGIILVSLQEAITESIRPMLQLLLGAVGVLLLIACGNVANLLLARASSREQEMALRRALGASRWRITSQMLTESTLLAGAGGVLGALLAIWLTSGLLSLAPEGIPRAGEVGMNLRFVAFAALISLASGMMTGILPSLRAAGRDGREGALFSGSRQAGSHGRSRARRALVIGEVAFSLILVVGAGLMVRTLMALNRVDPGFQPDRTITAHLSLPEISYPGDVEISDFVRRVEETVLGRPGVQSAGMILSLPIRSGLSGTFYFSIEGRASAEDDDPIAGYQVATPGYFEAMGIPLRNGRLFTEAEGADDPRVVLVNEAFAEQFWPGEEAIGHRITWSDPEGEVVEWSTIVGIVGNSLQGGLDEEPRTEIFRLYSQAPLTYMTLVARGEVGAGSLAAALRESVKEVDPRVPLYGMATMEDLLSESLGERRFAMSLLAIFAAVALLLAAVGLYGVLRYGVAQRTREIGIRVALGASTRGVVRKVMGEGLALTLLGLGVGVVLALPAGRLMSSMVFQVRTSDLTTYLISGFLLTVVALVACGPPALKGARTDPLEALREE